MQSLSPSSLRRRRFSQSFVTLSLSRRESVDGPYAQEAENEDDMFGAGQVIRLSRSRSRRRTRRRRAPLGGPDANLTHLSGATGSAPRTRRPRSREGGIIMTPPSRGGLVRLRATPDDGASPAASRTRRPCAPLPVDANRRGGRATDAVLPDAPGRTPAGAGEGEARRAGGVRHEERRAVESARAARTTTAIARRCVRRRESSCVSIMCVTGTEAGTESSQTPLGMPRSTPAARALHDESERFQ